MLPMRQLDTQNRMICDNSLSDHSCICGAASISLKQVLTLLIGPSFQTLVPQETARILTWPVMTFSMEPIGGRHIQPGVHPSFCLMKSPITNHNPISEKREFETAVCLKVIL